MGDSCWLEMTFLKKDQARLSEIITGKGDTRFWDEVIDEDDSCMTVATWGANYGLFEGRETAAKEGIVFHGYQGEGGNYGSCLFVSWNRQMMEATHADRHPTVRLNKKGNVMKSDLDNARMYMAYEKAAKEHMNRKP